MRRVEVQPQPSMTKVGIPVEKPERRVVPDAPPLPFQEPTPSPVAPRPATQPPVRTPQPVPVVR